MLLFRSKVTLDGYNLILLEGTLKKKKKTKRGKGLIWREVQASRSKITMSGNLSN